MGDITTALNDLMITGIVIGSALAITISWSLNHSIWWEIIHGIMSWFYIIFYAIWLS